MKTVAEALNSYIAAIPAKANLTSINLLVRAIFAGAMIAFGAQASNVAAHAISNVGLSRLVAGIIFPVGLMLVIFLGADLFTGDCMLALGIPGRCLSVRKCGLMLFTVYLGNCIGGFLVSLLTFLSGQFNYSSGLLGAYTIKVALGKVNLSFMSASASGILCNILVCAAVLMALCSSEASGKILVSFFVILAFVVSGFEHCVANMYYITAGLLCKLNPLYVDMAEEAYGITSEQLNTLNISSFIINNLLPVTIGNIIGGAFLFALPLYYVNKTITAKQTKLNMKEAA